MMATSTFKPLVPVASTADVSSAAQPSQPACKAMTEPVITCQRDGDRIARMVVTCRCGEKIEIDCEY